MRLTTPSERELLTGITRQSAPAGCRGEGRERLRTIGITPASRLRIVLDRLGNGLHIDGRFGVLVEAVGEGDQLVMLRDALLRTAWSKPSPPYGAL